jgi:predicted DNA-binding protein
MDDATRYEIGLPMDDQINVKMTKTLKERLNKMYAVTGLAPAEILRRLAYEAVIYFETHGDFTFPATITPGMKNQTASASTAARAKGQENMSAKIAAQKLEAARVTGKTCLPHERSKLTSAKGLEMPKRFKRGQRRPESVTDKF